ncbi:MAG: methyltransferase [Bacteroidia bacterium]|nr:methyltransferase [Bacteroidia bacterium]
MIPKTSNSSFIYTFNYDYHHEELCKMECRQMFGAKMTNKLLFSDRKLDPSISPFIKLRLDIIASASNYTTFLSRIKEQHIELHDFKVEYLILDGDDTPKYDRREKQKDIGYCIEGRPDFENPIITYALCHYDNIWHFGSVKKENVAWHKHRQKPHSFSNSIGTIIAKTLVTMASKGVPGSKLLDACCGVGTVMLEACISGIHIDGCDINVRAYQQALKNLQYYTYTAHLYHADIKDLEQQYDAAIIDLPYNLYSITKEDIASHIITATATLSDRLIIVSIADIESVIVAAGLQVIDYCTVVKRGKSFFTRKIWVCENKFIQDNE